MWQHLADGDSLSYSASINVIYIQYFVIVALIILLAYLTTYFIARHYQSGFKSREIKLIEKTNLAADRSLWLVELGDKYYFIYVDKNGASKLDIIDKDKLNIDSAAAPSKTVSFKQFLNKQLAGDETKNEK